MPPIFETERLLVRPRTLADLDDCLAMDRDPEVTRFIPGPWNDPVAHEAFVRTRIDAAFGEGLGYWSITPKLQPDLFLGWVLLIPNDGTGPDVEIGWRLNRAAWGQGFATEAARPVLEHGLRTVGLAEVIAEIDPDNGPSIHVARKLGLTFVQDVEHEGRPFKRFVIRRCDPGPD